VTIIRKGEMEKTGTKLNRYTEKYGTDRQDEDEQKKETKK
jgi:hypothetical protein